MGWLFIVSPARPGTYTYMKLVSESEHAVILDRRTVDRRQIHQPVTTERRHVERMVLDIDPAGRMATGIAQERIQTLRHAGCSIASPGEQSSVLIEVAGQPDQSLEILPGCNLLPFPRWQLEAIVPDLAP